MWVRAIAVLAGSTAARLFVPPARPATVRAPAGFAAPLTAYPVGSPGPLSGATTAGAAAPAAAPASTAAVAAALAVLAGGAAAVATVATRVRCAAPRASAAGSEMDRRGLLRGLVGAAALAAAPGGAAAKIESVNPANNYYFPMAKYRYLPRIFRAWIALDQLAPAALEVGDWEGLEEVWRRADDASTAMPLYANAVEGSRSGKKKTKTDAQKEMKKIDIAYAKDMKQMEKAVQSKNKDQLTTLLASSRAGLLRYREIAKIDTEDGGVIQMPLGNADEAGHAGAPLGYVVPAFRGGGISMDYNLRTGEEMMRNGVITKEYRERIAKEQAANK